jgi:glyoxylase-like metal-dependent hydrolase (beta-lactamase superfamily II)
MEIYPGLIMLETPFEGNRQINLWLVGQEHRLLVDTGVAGVPTETTIPQLQSLGLSPRDLDRIVNLHAHADHIGGNAELVRAAGGSLPIGAHHLDAEAIANHRVLATEIYNLTTEEEIQNLLRRVGDDVPVTERYKDGDRIDLGDMTLQVIHVPGHTPGSISLYDAAHKALIHGESVMGESIIDDDGLYSAPFGRDPVAYREGLQKLEKLEMAHFMSSHQPPTDGEAGHARIRASLKSLDLFASTCRAALASGADDAKHLATVVANEGDYRISTRLIEQVTNLLEHWREQGAVRRTESGGYALNQA